MVLKGLRLCLGVAPGMKQLGVVARAKELKTALSALLHPALFEFLLCEVGKLLIIPDCFHGYETGESLRRNAS